MEKKKLLLLAYRAFGDHVYWCSLIPILTEKYDVYLETNTKGWMLFCDDPRFKKVMLYNDFEKFGRNKYAEMFKIRWEKLKEEIKPDKIISLNGTLEVKCIAENFQDEFYLPVGERREIFGRHGFISATYEAAEEPIPEKVNLEGMYFWPDQIENCERWRKRHEGQFLVIIPIAGSTAQKVFHNYKEVAEKILERYPEAFIYFAGDEPCRQHVFEHPRVKTMIGADVSIKQAVQRTKYTDLVIGPETFLLAAAGMFGTPKIILATTSSVFQMTEFQKNDFSIQAPIACSPCHRAIYYEDDCEAPVFGEDKRFLATSCSKIFPVENILNRVDYVYQLWKQNLKPLIDGGVNPGPHLPASSSAIEDGDGKVE